MSEPVLGYVLRMFPQLSETFIANEILELERQGVRLRLFSYRRPRAEVEHECVRDIREPIEYLPDPLHKNLGPLFGAIPSGLAADAGRWAETTGYVAKYTARERNADTWRRLLQAGYLAKRVRETGLRHLHAHFAGGATRVAMLASRLTGVPFSFSAHARDVYTSKPHILRERIEAASFVVTCTGANQEYLREIVGPESRSKVLLGYHGIDLAKFQPNPAAEDDDLPVILAVGRLVRKKGLPDLLRACDRLRRDGLRFRCLIVGEGPERERLERMVTELALEGVVSLPGSRSQEEALEAYHRATVFTLPCRVLEDGDRDGIPNVILEAMACQLPIVTTNVSGIPEVVEHDRNGLLVPQRDPEALTAALASVLRSEELRTRLGAAARETVSGRFDRGENVRKLSEMFTERGVGHSATTVLAGAS
jgi:glycosyltransferase involved in cell wall biosynthesis